MNTRIRLTDVWLLFGPTAGMFWGLALASKHPKAPPPQVITVVCELRRINPPKEALLPDPRLPMVLAPDGTKERAAQLARLKVSEMEFDKLMEAIK